jgi:hypothetical protein
MSREKPDQKEKSEDDESEPHLNISGAGGGYCALRSGPKDSRDAETTAPSNYKVQDLGTLPEATYSPPTSAPYGINDFGHVVGMRLLVVILTMYGAILLSTLSAMPSSIRTV